MHLSVIILITGQDVSWKKVCRIADGKKKAVNKISPKFWNFHWDNLPIESSIHTQAEEMEHCSFHKVESNLIVPLSSVDFAAFVTVFSVRQYFCINALLIWEF